MPLETLAIGMNKNKVQKNDPKELHKISGEIFITITNWSLEKNQSTQCVKPINSLQCHAYFNRQLNFSVIFSVEKKTYCHLKIFREINLQNDLLAKKLFSRIFVKNW